MDLPRYAPPQDRTFFGKPLGWTRGWTVVVVVWAAAALLLVAARVEVGHVTALSAREAAAIHAVEAAAVPSGAGGDITTAEALQLVLRKYGATAAAGGGASKPQWYAMDRPWEDRVYVSWELGDYEPLGWTVDDDGTVTPDKTTRELLERLAQADAAGRL